MKRNVLTVLALAAVTGAALSTAALADRGDMMGMGGPGEMGMGGMGMGGMGMGPGQIDFAAMDADKDGKLTQAEIDAFRAAEVTAADADKDGKLSADELQAMMQKRIEARAADMAAGMVERHDADGDGLLTAAEFMMPAAPERMFGMADADGDGALTQEEIDAAQAQMAEMRGGEGRGHGRGHGHGGWGRWFGGDDQ